MDANLRNLLVRLATVLGEPESDENADDLIEVFGEVESKRAEIARILTAWLQSDSD